MHILNLETGIKEEVCVERFQSVVELKGCNKKTGWYINWGKMYKTPDVEVCAIRTTDETIQGLVALFDDKENKAVKIEWAVAVPHNNKLMSFNGRKAYEGVGACLFSIAAHRSVELGYGGFIYGFAINEKVLCYYKNTYDATYVGRLHPYHFVCDGCAIRILLEVYKNETVMR